MRGLIRILALLAVAALIVDLIGMSGSGIVTAQSGPNPAASSIGFMPNPSMESGGLSSFLLLVEGLIVSVRSVGLLIAAAATQLPTLFGYLLSVRLNFYPNPRLLCCTPAKTFTKCPKNRIFLTKKFRSWA